MSFLNQRHKGTHQGSQRQGIWDRPWPPNTHTHTHTHSQTVPSETPASQTHSPPLIFSPDFGGRVMCLGLLLNAHRTSVHLHYHAIWYCTYINDVIILTAAVSFRPAEQTCLPAADRAVMLGDVILYYNNKKCIESLSNLNMHCSDVFNEYNIYTWKFKECKITSW